MPLNTSCHFFLSLTYGIYIYIYSCLPMLLQQQCPVVALAGRKKSLFNIYIYLCVFREECRWSFFGICHIVSSIYFCSWASQASSRVLRFVRASNVLQTVRAVAVIPSHHRDSQNRESLTYASWFPPALWFVRHGAGKQINIIARR